MSKKANEVDEPEETGKPVTLAFRLRVALALLVGLRKHDFRSALTYMRMRFGRPWSPISWVRFAGWSLHQMFIDIPPAMRDITSARPVSRVPFWLKDGNLLSNHPWSATSSARFPTEADTVVIGAGFTGSAAAYHWSKRAPRGRHLVLLDMGDPASGSSGRNEGVVVMGRHFAMTYSKMASHLERVRDDLPPWHRERLAKQFAAVYCRAAYHNADLIAQTIEREDYQCDYHREGWVSAGQLDSQCSIDESARMAADAGVDDWQCIPPEEVTARTGVPSDRNGNFSAGAALFHPAKWVWSLLGTAIRYPNVQLFTRTRVNRVEDVGEFYIVHTDRGPIRCQYVLNATESYTPGLHRQFHDVLSVNQTQAASGEGGPTCLKHNVPFGGRWWFCGRHGNELLIGSDQTRVPDHEAGRIQPSRFLTKFFLADLRKWCGAYRFHLTHEWSGTIGLTLDEYPIVGCMDGKRQYIIAGMGGSGTAVSFNGARCIVNRIIELDEPDDYPEEYFSPSRVLCPKQHCWPELDDRHIRMRLDPPERLILRDQAAEKSTQSIRESAKAPQGQISR